jgi:hypothetical protein
MAASDFVLGPDSIQRRGKTDRWGPPVSGSVADTGLARGG